MPYGPPYVCPCNQQPAQPMWTIETETTEDCVSGRVVLIVEKGSVVSKPSYVDLIEMMPGTMLPVVVNNGTF